MDTIAGRFGFALKVFSNQTICSELRSPTGDVSQCQTGLPSHANHLLLTKIISQFSFTKIESPNYKLSVSVNSDF
jgi:hypothetical protein